MNIKKIKPLVYVSGPYSNGGHSVEKNVEIANMYAHELRKLGFAVICPHANTTYSLNHEISWEAWMEEDYVMILNCHALYMLPHWKDSRGAVIEHQWAQDLGIPIFYWDIANDGYTFSKDIEKGKVVCEDQFKLIYEFFFNPRTVWQRCPNQVHEFIKTINQMFRTHIKKNNDYSPHNILGTGEVGLMTRTWDKVSRLMNLIGFDLKTGQYSKPVVPKNESVDDTIIDMAVYSVIWQLFRKGKWGN